MDAQELLKIIQEKDQTIAQLREQLHGYQMVLAQQKSATTQSSTSVFRRLHVEVLLACIISYLDVKSISKCAVTANSTFQSFTGVFHQHRVVFEKSLGHYLSSTQALSLYPIQCSSIQEWWQACGRFARFSRRDPAYVRIFNCFALSSKSVSLKYLLAAFGRGARPDYSLRMLSQPTDLNNKKISRGPSWGRSKSKSKKSMYHDRDTIKGSFRVGIDFVTRSLAIPKLGMAKIQVYNAKVAKLEPTDLADPCSCFIIFFQRGDTRSYREATLAANNLCGATSTGHRPIYPEAPTRIQGALVCVDCQKYPFSPTSSPDEDNDEEEIPDFRESKHEDDNESDRITANAIKFAHAHHLAYYDLKSKFGRVDNAAFMKELDEVFVALGQKCVDKVREQTIAQHQRATRRRPSRRGSMSGQAKGAECTIQ